jgi:hypothetical protein
LISLALSFYTRRRYILVNPAGHHRGASLVPGATFFNSAPSNMRLEPSPSSKCRLPISDTGDAIPCLPSLFSLRVSSVQHLACDRPSAMLGLVIYLGPTISLPGFNIEHGLLPQNVWLPVTVSCCLLKMTACASCSLHSAALGLTLQHTSLSSGYAFLLQQAYFSSSMLEVGLTRGPDHLLWLTLHTPARDSLA